MAARAEVPTRDVAAIFLSLKDEAAECRFLMQLCADYDAAFMAWNRATFHNPGGGREEEAAVDRAGADVTHAVEILLVKHERLPRCVNECLKTYPVARSRMVKWHPAPKEPGSHDWEMPKSLVK
jgi:hypothetical protein